LNKNNGFWSQGKPVFSTVATVGTDAVENKEGKLLYRVLLKQEQAEFRLITGRVVPISAGMSATAEIKTKKKRIIEYYLDTF
jgi:hemolysin D